MFSLVADVDVLMPIRSPHLPWLREALASVAAQEGVNARLVAVLHPDDQGLESEIRGIGLPTEVVLAPSMGNISDALNAGLEVCSAPLVARLDADDIAEPTRLARQCEEIDRFPGCAVLASSVTLIDAAGTPVGIRPTPTTSGAIERLMKWKCAIAHPSVLFRRDVVVSVGGYSPVAAHSEDYELWLRILAIASIASLPEPLVRYRIHGGQLTASTPVPHQAAEAVLRGRLALAHARGDSLIAARLRHRVWNGRQGLRRLVRQTA